MRTLCFCVVGLIHVGDELKEVNGIPVEDKKPEEIIRILVSLICLCVAVFCCVCAVQRFPVCSTPLARITFLVCDDRNLPLTHPGPHASHRCAENKTLAFLYKSPNHMY